MSYSRVYTVHTVLSDTFHKGCFVYTLKGTPKDIRSGSARSEPFARCSNKTKRQRELANMSSKSRALRLSAALNARTQVLETKTDPLFRKACSKLVLHKLRMGFLGNPTLNKLINNAEVIARFPSKRPRTT
eukprot:990223-Pyramimonas_sp.AAC.2